MEPTTQKSDGSPYPGLQTTDGETAGTESEYPKISICPYESCISRENGRCLHDGHCEPCDQDGNPVKVFKTLAECARCRVVSKCDAHVTGGSYRQCAPILDTERLSEDEKIEGIIDSDLTDAVILLGAKAEALEPGFDAAKWLKERNL